MKARTFGAQRGKPRCNLTQEARSRGGFASGKIRRQRAIAALDGMTPTQIFRLAFARGWHAGVRSARRRMGVAA
jgi:hypothetical protein